MTPEILQRLGDKCQHRWGVLPDGHAVAWGKQTEQFPAFKHTLLPSAKGDVPELDELWSFAQSKAQTLWLRMALCRRTRQISHQQ